MDFAIKRSLEGKDLDSAAVTIFNPSKDCVDLVMSSENTVFIDIHAWYYSTSPDGIRPSVFLGSIDTPIKYNDKEVDHTLNFTALDGYTVLAKKKYAGSLAAGTSYMTILQDVINQAVGGKVSTSSVSPGVKAKLALEIKPDAWVESGSFADVLNTLCKQFKLSWTLQSGIPRVVLKNDRFQLKYYDLGNKVLIEPLLPEKVSGSTEIIYKCKSFYLTGVLPGDYISIMGGKYIITSLEHNLSNYGDDFTTSLILEELG